MKISKHDIALIITTTLNRKMYIEFDPIDVDFVFTLLHNTDFIFDIGHLEFICKTIYKNMHTMKGKN